MDDQRLFVHQKELFTRMKEDNTEACFFILHQLEQVKHSISYWII